MIRGNLTNLFLVDTSKKIFSFKKLKKENQYYLEILENLEFINSNSYSFDENKLKPELKYSDFRKDFPHIGKEIFNEAK
jgi:hypothetical protein